MQGLFKGAESSDEDQQQKQARSLKKSPLKRMTNSDIANNFTRGSHKSQKKKRRSALKNEQVSQLMVENEMLKKAMSQFQEKYNRMMGLDEDNKHYIQ